LPDGFSGDISLLELCGVGASVFMAGKVFLSADRKTFRIDPTLLSLLYYAGSDPNELADLIEIYFRENQTNIVRLGVGLNRDRNATTERKNRRDGRASTRCRASLIIGPHAFGSKVVWGQTLSMNKLSVSPMVYAELPVEARALLFIFALAAAARYVAQPPKRLELTPLLETIWNRNRLGPSDLANPFRITALLETELSSICFAERAQ
jgi:hypothetical protein